MEVDEDLVDAHFFEGVEFGFGECWVGKLKKRNGGMRLRSRLRICFSKKTEEDDR